jgi:integrase
MASIWKRPDSQFWIACWTSKEGRQLKRSTKTTSKKDALKLANQFEAESLVRRTAKQARKVLTDIYRETMGQDMPRATVREFSETFLAARRSEVSKSTLDAYKGAAKAFSVFLGPRADADIASIQKSEIASFRDSVRAKTSAKTTNNILKCLRVIFAAALRDGYLVEDFAKDVSTVRDTEETIRRPFTLPELKAVLEVADSEWKSMVLFGFFTGQRLTDIATLAWPQIDLSRETIRFTTSKTRKKLELPLAAPLVKHIMNMPTPDSPSAPMHPAAAAKVKQRGRAGDLSNQFAKILEAAGIRKPDEVERPERGRMRHELSFHCLRHSATSILKDAGIPQSVVQAYVGHDDIRSSAQYTHVGLEALQKAAASLPDLTLS